jgi:hypothetical protein
LSRFSPAGRLLTMRSFFNNRSSTNFCFTFVHGNNHVQIFAKKRFRYIFADFFTNSSGHPACEDVIEGGGTTQSLDRSTRPLQPISISVGDTEKGPML